MSKKNLVILVCCQLISATGSIVMVTLGGIIGSKLSSNPALATLPMTTLVLAVAATTVPATLLMKAIGRRWGFAMASGTAVLGVLIAYQALVQESFFGFVAATMVFGINMAFTQQYRYAAAESVEPKYTARAISFVLVGSIGGAVLGPELATRGYAWVEGVPYAGTILTLALLYGLQILLFTQLENTQPVDVAGEYEPGRPLGAVVKQPVFLVAVLGGTAGYGLMTLLMTATPLSMHINDGYSLERTAAVIQAHVLGMYVPSLVSGVLIDRIGVSRLMFLGALLLLATSVVGMQGQSYLHYWWALVLLGVGWNFLYVGGTTMLTYTYTAEERFKAQAVNEFLVFGLAAAASLLAGSVMHYFGWTVLMWIPIPVLVLTCIAILLTRKDTLLESKA